MDETHSSTTRIGPRIALLGFCERSAEITAGHPAQWHKNIMGLSTTRISHVYPFELRGQNLAVALYNVKVGEELLLDFRPTTRKRGFDIKLSISGAEEFIVGDDGAVTSRQLETGKPFRGWSFHVFPIGTGAVALEPDTYHVFQVETGAEYYLGASRLVHATVRPFTPEDIAAIRSDPLAMKVVRYTLSCKVCHVELRTYTGLERNDKLEAEGWIWYELLPENFPCECAERKNDFSLKYLRTGFHGVLRQNLTPAGKAAAGTIDTVRLYERTALEQDCRKFLKLIQTKTKEEEIQKFLESHTIFFSSFLPIKLMVKKPVLTQYIVDFAIVNQRKELLLIEIERPGIPLVKKDGGIRSELQHAIDQVRRWIQVFNDHRAAALECFDLKLEDVARIRGTVIAGRTPLDEKQARLLRATSWGDIDFFTYDDLLKGTSDIIKQIATI